MSARRLRLERRLPRPSKSQPCPLCRGGRMIGVFCWQRKGRKRRPATVYYDCPGCGGSGIVGEVPGPRAVPE